MHSIIERKWNMIGLGTIVNTAVVLAGGGIGLLLKKGIGESLQTALTKAIGVAVILVGVSGVLQEMLTVDNGSLSSHGTIMLIISLVAGTLFGELLKIEQRLENLGDRLKKLMKSGDSRFTEGFVTNTLVICVGAMAIVGSLNDGLHGDPTMLFAKSILDGVIAVVFASTMGVGVLFAAIPMFIYQGGITLLAGLLSDVLSAAMISNLSCVGSALILVIGLNMALGAKIKTGNMLPALIVPIIWTLLAGA